MKHKHYATCHTCRRLFICSLSVSLLKNNSYLNANSNSAPEKKDGVKKIKIKLKMADHSQPVYPKFALLFGTAEAIKLNISTYPSSRHH